jgi:peptidoglycan/LPS O-acetylase OafA/YrhL
MAERSLQYRPYLDGLRGIAVLLVFVFHAARPGLPGGFIGVDIFFVLSGYLITRILLTQHATAGKIRISDFYARRIRRLMPAVILVVLVVVVREAVWGDIIETATRLRDAVATLFYVENWNLIHQADQYFEASLSPSPLRHAWSLSIEEQFYLAWPILVIAILAVTKRRTGRAALLVLAAAAASALAMALLFEPGLVTRAYYGTDSRVQQPLIGAALAFMVMRAKGRSGEEPRPWVWPAIAGAALGLLIVASRILTGETTAYYFGGSTVVALLAAVLVLALERSPEGWMSRALGWSPLKQLGRISYGFYLWHWPVILWMAVPDGFGFWERRVVNLAQFGLTLAVSIASFILIESPIRDRTIRLGRLGSPATIAVGVGTLAVAAVASVAILGAPGSPIVAAAESPSPTVVTAGESPGPPSTIADEEEVDLAMLAEQALADRSFEPCPEDPQPCVKVEGATADAPTVALIGDSTAQSYDPALKELATRYGFRYVQAALGGCPISHRLIATGEDGQLHKASNLRCFDVIPGVYETVLDEYDPDLIIATSWNESNRHVVDGVVLEKGTPEHLAATEAALRETVAQLTSRGALLAFIDILPPGWSVDCLETGPPTSAECTRAVTPETGEGPYNDLFDEIATENPSVVDIDFSDILCPDGACPLLVDGVVMRYDGNHFTATGSRKMAPLIEERLDAEGIDLQALSAGLGTS